MDGDAAVRVVSELVEPFLGAPGLDVGEALDDPAIAATRRRLLAADAPIEFRVPGGGFVGPMAGPFRGPEGFEAGWAEWLRTFDSFRTSIDDLVAVGGGRVLVLATAVAHLKGSETPMEHKAAGLYTVADGQVTKIEHFLDQDQARAAAGME